MNNVIFAADESQVLDQFVEHSSLTFVEDAEYEFVGGGASSTNGF
jgi:hypothetical protein